MKTTKALLISSVAIAIATVAAAQLVRLADERHVGRAPRVCAQTALIWRKV